LLQQRTRLCRLYCMQSTTVRVDLTTHKVLTSLARETHFSIQTALNNAVETKWKIAFASYWASDSESEYIRWTLDV
jgi:hypothetical protein